MLRAAVAPVEANATEYSPVKAQTAESMLASRASERASDAGSKANVRGKSRPEHHALNKAARAHGVRNENPKRDSWKAHQPSKPNKNRNPKTRK